MKTMRRHGPGYIFSRLALLLLQMCIRDRAACSLAGQRGRGERVFAPARPGRPKAASREKAPAETSRFKNLLATPCQPYAPTMARRASRFFITSAWMTTEVSGPMTSEIGSA